MSATNNSSSGKARTIPCPTCRKPTVYDVSSPFRPFCSTYCKDRDIIAWAEGDFAIPVEAQDDEAEVPSPAGAGSDD